jgi:hypothetical protein
MRGDGKEGKKRDRINGRVAARRLIEARLEEKPLGEDPAMFEALLAKRAQAWLVRFNSKLTKANKKALCQQVTKDGNSQLAAEVIENDGLQRDDEGPKVVVPTEAELRTAVASAQEKAIKEGCTSEAQLVVIAKDVCDQWRASVDMAREKNAMIDEQHTQALADVCVHACMHVCMCACVYVHVHPCIHACVCACMYACEITCMHATSTQLAGYSKVS